eukprot:TRINITY_DN1871_c0_g1_i1.p1 TRINITY_DN1871_c0_g1~~TRINITY_DN1871_c0_g1_i1.p1  ORF type:complete len:61 (-),score=5.03 TRINITY_DN1871_c0_g1_i1:2-184(-)
MLLIIHKYMLVLSIVVEKGAMVACHSIIRCLKLLEDILLVRHVLCVDTGRSSETAKAHRG